MNCTDFEALLSDYLDGTLNAADSSALEQHAATCVTCREFMQDVAGAVRFVRRVEPVVPPPNLITHIAFYAPTSRIRRSFESQSFWSKLKERWLAPVLQPRFAMGMAMTILSFAMLERCTGVPVSHIQAADLNPQRVWGGVEDRAVRVKDRFTKYYENLRLVYEIEARIRDLQETADSSPQPQPAGERQNQGTKPTSVDGGKQQLLNQPDQNRNSQGGNSK